MRQRLEVLALGMVSPVGLTASAVAAATRAGISRVQETPFVDLHFQPLLGACVPDRYLPELPAAVTTRGGFAFREERMLRLSGLALREATRQCQEPPSVFLALPEDCEAALGRTPSRFFQALAEVAGVSLDIERSRCFPMGRAAGLLALQEASEQVARRQLANVIIGGADSFMDPLVLSTFEQEGRLRRGGPSDGFFPGEGAAFLWLGAEGSGRRSRVKPIACIEGVGTGREPGHRYSQEPYRGEGLAEAFQALFASRPASAPRVGCVYTGLNGESFWAKEWGVAFLRAKARFNEDVSIYHPVENFGDPGAALGPLMLGLTAIGLQRGYRHGPCLVWCSSDREERGAALVSSAREE